MEITAKNKNVLTLLLFIPILLSLFLQGGYFQEEKYLILLSLMPFLFYYSFKFSNYFFFLREKGFLFFSLYAAGSFLTILRSVNKGATIEASIEIFFYLFLFYFVANAIYNGFLEKVKIENFLIFLGILGAVLSLVAILLIKNQGSIPLNSTILTYIRNNILTTNIASASAFFGYKNTFGAFICIPFFILLGKKGRSGKIVEIFLKYLALTLFTFTIFLSQSRFAAIIFVLLLIFFLFLGEKQQRKESFLYTLSIFVTIFVFSFFNSAIFYKYFTEIISRFSLGINYLKNTAGSAFDVSLYQRIEMLKYSFEIFKQNFILGTGKGTYSYIYNVFKTTGLYAEDPHSALLLLLAENGIVGFLAVLPLSFFFLIRSNKREIGILVGTLAILLHCLLDFDLKFMALNLIIILLVAFLLYNNKKEKPIPPGNKTNGLKMMALLLVIAFIPMLSAFYYGEFTRNYDKNVNLAYSDIQKAASIFRLSSEYNYEAGKYILIKIIMEKPTYDINFSKTGEEYYLKAIALAPTYWEYYEALGNYYLGSKQLSKALPILEKAIALNKYYPNGYFAMANYYLAMNNPSMEEYYKNLGLKYLALNQY